MVELLQRVALFEFAETVINGEEKRELLLLIRLKRIERKGKESDFIISFGR